VITLYRAPYSTNVERVALALAHKGLEVRSEVIDNDDRSLVEAVSGQGLVPVIEDDETDQVVVDSTEILRYLERHYPSPPLFPADPARRAETEIFLEWFNEVWKSAPHAIEFELEHVGQLEHEHADQNLIAEEAARMAAWLDQFEQMLEGRDFLMGDRLSAADCAAFPFLKYAAGRDPDDTELFHRVLEIHQELGKGHPRLDAWIQRIDALPRA
jgi:glutathione S-transferase